jgi:hypothetical protein
VLILVIVVVLAGVGFAGFQLKKSASGDLAEPKDSSLEVSAQHIRITTSVTGILVLLISLAFLWIFADRFYDMQPDKTTDTHSQPATPVESGSTASN